MHPFLQEILPFALEAKKKWPGMRVSCCLAQSALETAWGKKKIGGWNLWGIKDLSWDPGFVIVGTHEYKDGEKVPESAKFEDFPTPEEAFNAYGRLVTNSKYYKEAREAPDLDTYIAKLASRWATDPKYAEKVLSIIAKEDLRKYDEENQSDGSGADAAPVSMQPGREST